MRKELETYFGTEKEVNEIISKTKKSMKEIEKKWNMGSAMICSHNSILVLKDTKGEITYVINPKKEKGLVFVETLDHNLAVPRYEPEIAQKWLKDETAKLTGDPETVEQFKKAVVSEMELSKAVYDKLKIRLELYEQVLAA